MTFTKKFLALLLAAILLCSFGVGANAAAPEDMTPEELEAYGRALLMQTMEDLRGDYTINDRIVHSGGNYAFISEGSREIHIGGEAYLIIRNMYMKLDSPNHSREVSLLEPKEITADTPISVKLDRGKWLSITAYGYLYSFFDNMLDSINDGNWPLFINEFRNSADRSLLSIEGMREISAFQEWLLFGWPSDVFSTLLWALQVLPKNFFNRFVNLLTMIAMVLIPPLWPILFILVFG